MLDNKDASDLNLGQGANRFKPEIQPYCKTLPSILHTRTRSWILLKSIVIVTVWLLMVYWILLQNWLRTLKVNSTILSQDAQVHATTGLSSRRQVTRGLRLFDEENSWPRFEKVSATHLDALHKDHLFNTLKVYLCYFESMKYIAQQNNIIATSSYLSTTYGPDRECNLEDIDSQLELKEPKEKHLLTDISTLSMMATVRKASRIEDFKPIISRVQEIAKLIFTSRRRVFCKDMYKETLRTVTGILCFGNLDVVVGGGRLILESIIAFNEPSVVYGFFVGLSQLEWSSFTQVSLPYITRYVSQHFTDYPQETIFFLSQLNSSNSLTVPSGTLMSSVTADGLLRFPATKKKRLCRMIGIKQDLLNNTDIEKNGNEIPSGIAVVGSILTILPILDVSDDLLFDSVLALFGSLSGYLSKSNQSNVVSTSFIMAHKNFTLVSLLGLSIESLVALVKKKPIYMEKLYGKHDVIIKLLNDHSQNEVIVKGLLTINFKPLWEDARKILKTFADTSRELYWTLCFAELAKFEDERLFVPRLSKSPMVKQPKLALYLLNANIYQIHRCRKLCNVYYGRTICNQRQSSLCQDLWIGKTPMDFWHYYNMILQNIDGNPTIVNSNIKPYSDNLRNLLDDTKFRDELSTFIQNHEQNLIDPAHRDGLMPIVMRLLFGRLVERRSKGSKHVKKLRRKAILGAVSCCKQNEMKTFIDLALEPFQSLLNVPGETLDDEGRVTSFEFVDQGSEIILNSMATTKWIGECVRGYDQAIGI
ncbi:down-regulated in metastasis-domain-containing protein [Absidia repens]|uniref:Down-regulated in metastasis-domain-containing protein n=1 Tax=Absidia repens TaxID=90262 RepID=A0A1X2IRB2_9FUNG|nr:down-regulated in metastasis-domain-containing protein [Absidia repens]